MKIVFKKGFCLYTLIFFSSFFNFVIASDKISMTCFGLLNLLLLIICLFICLELEPTEEECTEEVIQNNEFNSSENISLKNNLDFQEVMKLPIGSEFIEETTKDYYILDSSGQLLDYANEDITLNWSSDIIASFKFRKI